MFRFEFPNFQSKDGVRSFTFRVQEIEKVDLGWELVGPEDNTLLCISWIYTTLILDLLF